MRRVSRFRSATAVTRRGVRVSLARVLSGWPVAERTLSERVALRSAGPVESDAAALQCVFLTRSSPAHDSPGRIHSRNDGTPLLQFFLVWPASLLLLV